MQLIKEGIGLAIILALFMVLGLAGCTRLAIKAAEAALEDRTTEDQVTDTKISTGITTRLADKDAKLVLAVSADVWEQRVLLTGAVSDASIKKEVVALVKEDSRIREVYDEILIVPEEEASNRVEEQKKHEANKEDKGDTGNDYWISGEIKTKLVSTKGITSVNYRWHTVNGVVYLIGRARSERELKKILRICRGVDGVKQVKQFVEVKPI